MGAQTVMGMQEHVIATAKHFIVNEQETNRQPSSFGLGNASVSATLEASRLNDMVKRYAIEFNVGSLLTYTSSIVAPWIKLAKFEPGSGLPVDVSKENQIVSAINPLSRRNIFQGAAEGIVLVKNHNHTLPLK